MHQKDSDSSRTRLFNEAQLLELIYAATPITQLLNKICNALDVQVGNVVSLVLFPEDEEHTLHTIAENAVEFGLHAFRCTAILSPNAELLGTLETYCCFPRIPNPEEEKLIQRAAHLSALAIQQHNRQMNREYFSRDRTGARRNSSRQRRTSDN
jgi:GAF domain-containing protein